MLQHLKLIHNVNESLLTECDDKDEDEGGVV